VTVIPHPIDPHAPLKHRSTPYPHHLQPTQHPQPISHQLPHHSLPPQSPTQPHQASQHLPITTRLLTAFTLLLTLTLSACGTDSTDSPAADLADNQAILATCNPAAPPASLIALDGSGSSKSDAITAERMSAVDAVVQRTAVCGGFLRVIVFSGSSAGAAVLFDGSMAQDGATDNARLKRVPEAVKKVTEQIRAGYGPAVAAQNGGSDIVGQYRLASEWISQLGGRYRLHLYVLTDGFQTTMGVDLSSQALSPQDTAGLASQAVVPKLPGASVVVAGLGRMAGGVPPSNVVEGLVAFYDHLCQRTGATQCASVTSYSTEGR